MKGLSTQHKALLVQWIFDRIPAKFKKELLDKKSTALNFNKDRVRVQCYIPLEVYIVLAAFGGFLTSESDFFTQVATEWVDRRAKEQGLTGPLGEKEEVGNGDGHGHMKGGV